MMKMKILEPVTKEEVDISIEAVIIEEATSIKEADINREEIMSSSSLGATTSRRETQLVNFQRDPMKGSRNNSKITLTSSSIS